MLLAGNCATKPKRILLTNELVALSAAVQKIREIKEGSPPPPELEEFSQHGVSLLYRPSQASEESKAD